MALFLALCALAVGCAGIYLTMSTPPRPAEKPVRYEVRWRHTSTACTVEAHNVAASDGHYWFTDVNGRDVAVIPVSDVESVSAPARGQFALVRRSA